MKTNKVIKLTPKQTTVAKSATMKSRENTVNLKAHNNTLMIKNLSSLIKR
ncbi:hypothetical protein GCM10011531_20900 [Aquaticitalea lipolytica]|uniref:Uncharacterized protein n=1 Tax=Aquaticitalea lipolytica TaxID=1247562 RepID=A0A8J2XJ68_9FLAO|nr:hypothetical protein GCM10011531_20900 [Aquaticitalea lipolytica]